MTHTDAARSSSRAVVQTLESLQRAGVTHLPRANPAAAPTIPSASQPTAPHIPSTPAANPPTGPAIAAPAGLFGSDIPAGDSLEIIRQEVAACQRCQVLATQRTQTVFGVGNPDAQLCFLGEAPGADEDAQGEPFVGRAGQLLTKIIEACTLQREDVYILNVLKCRPPGNRNPLPDEVDNCRGFLDRQLALIRPQFICCLGSIAAQTLLQTTATIGKLRGRFHDYHGIRVLCTYHPAYLLRNPAAKRDVWEDMQLLMREIGVKRP